MKRILRGLILVLVALAAGCGKKMPEFCGRRMG